MWNRSKGWGNAWTGDLMPIFLANTCRADHAKITVNCVISEFPPNHGNSKRQSLSFSSCPIAKHFLIVMTHHMRWPFLVLVTKGNLKIRFSGTLHKRSDITSLTKQCIAPTYITERIRLIFTFTSMRRSHVYTWYNKTFCKPNNSRKHVAQQYKSKLIYKCKKYGRWKTVVGWPLLKSLDQLTTCAVLYTLPTANSRILLQSHAFWLLSNLVVIHDRTQSVLFPGTSIRVAAGPYKQAVLMLWFDFSDCTSSTSCCHRLHMLHCNDMSGLCWHQLHLSLLVLEVLQLENLLICNADKS